MRDRAGDVLTKIPGTKRLAVRRDGRLLDLAVEMLRGAAILQLGSNYGNTRQRWWMGCFILGSDRFDGRMPKPDLFDRDRSSFDLRLNTVPLAQLERFTS